ncbi:hypothetical protein N7462_008991 [Penicillium macrosclerotiorum]|uniref:uncharacterized protein n=1 Tax=Penicillium macrosclerotiorum TaxID=303699 RepID=UPI002546EBF0|nr:uncharacterized protein N7462_008991 [Penicillium macrosclerotiorum]KAJ5676094.1 hypothetical protein N7462_008991 [Penicillium macrosclerotiorum]
MKDERLRSEEEEGLQGKECQGRDFRPGENAESLHGPGSARRVTVQMSHPGPIGGGPSSASWHLSTATRRPLSLHVRHDAPQTSTDAIHSRLGLEREEPVITKNSSRQAPPKRLETPSGDLALRPLRPQLPISDLQTPCGTGAHELSVLFVFPCGTIGPCRGGSAV